MRNVGRSRDGVRRGNGKDEGGTGTTKQNIRERKGEDRMCCTAVETGMTLASNSLDPSILIVNKIMRVDGPPFDHLGVFVFPLYSLLGSIE